MLCDIWTGQFINILGNIMMFHAAKFQNCQVTLFLPYRINCQGTIYSICKNFFRYTTSKKDMDIDMI